MYRCEDSPCCGHEAGDCQGQKYGTDEQIKERVYAEIRNGHGNCDHESGHYVCEDVDNEYVCGDCDQIEDECFCDDE